MSLAGDTTTDDAGPFGGARLDFDLRRSGSFALEVRYTDEDGNAPDLTGYTARLDVRTRTDVAPATAGTPVLEFRTSPTGAQGTIVLGGTASETLDDGTVVTVRIITISATATQTAAVTPTTPGAELVYDLELVSGSTVDVPISGYVRVLPEVTR